MLKWSIATTHQSTSPPPIDDSIIRNSSPTRQTNGTHLTSADCDQSRDTAIKSAKYSNTDGLKVLGQMGDYHFEGSDWNDKGRDSASTLSQFSHVNQNLGDSLESTTHLDPDREYSIKWTDTDSTNANQTIAYQNRLSEISLADVLDLNGCEDNNRFSIANEHDYTDLSPYTSNFKAVAEGSHVVSKQNSIRRSNQTLVSPGSMIKSSFSQHLNENSPASRRLSPIPFPRTPPQGSQNSRADNLVDHEANNNSTEPLNKETQKRNIINALTDYYNFQKFLADHKILPDQILTPKRGLKQGTKQQNRWVRVIPNGNSNAEEYMPTEALTPNFANHPYDNSMPKDSYPSRGRQTPYRSSTTSNRTGGSENCINEIENGDENEDKKLKRAPIYPPYMSNILPPFVLQEQQIASTAPAPPKSRSHTDGFANGEIEDNINESILRAINHEVKVKAAGLRRANLSPVPSNANNFRKSGSLRLRDSQDLENGLSLKHQWNEQMTNHKPYTDIINEIDDKHTTGKMLASPEVPYVDESICGGDRGSSQNGIDIDKNDSGCHTGSHNDGDGAHQDGNHDQNSDNNNLIATDSKDPRDSKLGNSPIPQLPYSPSVLMKNRRKRRPMVISRKPNYEKSFNPIEPAGKNNRPETISNNESIPYFKNAHGNERYTTPEHSLQASAPKRGINPLPIPHDETNRLSRSKINEKNGSTQFSLSSLPEVRRAEGLNLHRLPLSPTFPPAFYKTTDNEHGKRSRIPSRVPRSKRGMPIHWYAVTDPRQTFFGILSYLYGLFLIVMGAVLPLAEVFTPKVSYMFYEGFYLYLYCGSILFLLYAYCFLINKKRSSESCNIEEEIISEKNKTKLKKHDNKLVTYQKVNIKRDKVNGNLYNGHERHLSALPEEINGSTDLGIENRQEPRDGKKKKVVHKINGVNYRNTLERDKMTRRQLKKQGMRKRGFTCCSGGVHEDGEELSSDSTLPTTPETDIGLNGIENGSALDSSLISEHLSGGQMTQNLVGRGNDTNLESTTIPLLNDPLNNNDPDFCDNKKMNFIQSDYTSHTGSFYLRMGAVAFATGSMIFNGLKFGQSFELARNPPCFNLFRGILPLMHLIFTFIQLYFIFLNSKMCINKYKVFAKFGLMHMFATNVCVFLSTIIKETAHDIVFKGLYTYPAQVNITSQGSSNISSCRKKYMMGNIVKDASPYLYPCNVEYSIICASILYIMWSNIGSYKQSGFQFVKSMKNVISLREFKNEDKLSQVTASPQAQVDCRGSSKGLFAGILTLVMCIICLILFFVLIKNPLYSEVAFFMSSCSEITVYTLTIIAILISLIKTKVKGRRNYKGQGNVPFENYMKHLPTDTTVSWHDENGFYVEVVPATHDGDKIDINTKDYYYRFSNVDNTLESSKPPNTNHEANFESKNDCSRDRGAGKNQETGLVGDPHDFIYGTDDFNVIDLDRRYESHLPKNHQKHSYHEVCNRVRPFMRTQKNGLGKLDSILQFMAIMGEYLLAGFSIVATYRSLQDGNNETILVMTTSVLSVIQVTCQTVFLLDQFSNHYVLATLSNNQSSAREQLCEDKKARQRARRNGSYLQLNNINNQDVEVKGHISSRVRVSPSMLSEGLVYDFELPKYKPTPLPPRQLVTFLLVANLALWAVDAFAIERAKANPVQAIYFGPLMWSIITHACVPLIIFYRFHSSICLAEIWKACYNKRSF